MVANEVSRPEESQLNSPLSPITMSAALLGVPVGVEAGSFTWSAPIPAITRFAPAPVTIVSPQVASVLAREVGVRTSVLSPIESRPTGDGPRDYVGRMDRNLDVLASGLGCVNR